MIGNSRCTIEWGHLKAECSQRVFQLITDDDPNISISIFENHYLSCLYISTCYTILLPYNDSKL